MPRIYWLNTQQQKFLNDLNDTHDSFDQVAQRQNVGRADLRRWFRRKGFRRHLALHNAHTRCETHTTLTDAALHAARAVMSFIRDPEAPDATSRDRLIFSVAKTAAPRSRRSLPPSSLRRSVASSLDSPPPFVPDPADLAELQRLRDLAHQPSPPTAPITKPVPETAITN